MKWNSLEVKGNTFYGRVGGLDRARFPENTYLDSRPKGLRVFVRPNKYEPGRANICVFNWDNLDSVPADVSKVLEPGDTYELRDVESFLGGPVARGTYDGKPVMLPMRLTEVTQPITRERHEHTPPEFGAFVLLRTAAAKGPAATPPPAGR